MSRCTLEAFRFLWGDGARDMTVAAEWPTATEDGPDVGPSAREGLGSLVRRWMAASQELESRGGPAASVPDATSEGAPRATYSPPDQLDQLDLLDPEPLDRLDDLLEAPEATEAPPVLAPLPRRRRQALPRRRRQPQVARRLAVLIDAESMAVESAEALFRVLEGHGTVTVCRAYADWTSAESETWSSPLRRLGIQPRHHFAREGDHRSLVALTIDAVDLVRESAVDTVAIVGDLTSVHPLVMRLNSSGVRVLAFGTSRTPHDVRALCHEFVDLSSLQDRAPTPAGRHRA